MAKETAEETRGKDYSDPPPAPFIDAHEFSLWSFYRACITEFLATLLFLYITITIVVDASKAVGLLGIARAFGGIIFILVYCTAGISAKQSMGKGTVQSRPGDLREMSVRFLVNKANSRILYLEAGKDLVDMLSGFLQLPAATIFSMFSSGDATTALKVGCLSNIYESLQKLNTASLVVNKEVIMHPPCAFELSTTSPQLLLPAQPDAPPLLPTQVFRCNSCSGVQHTSWVSGENCRNCGRQSSMNCPISMTGALPPALVTPSPTPAVLAGYVQHYLSFIVTNDLSILPASTIESIVLLNKLGVEKMSDLDSFESSISANEALELLKVSFTSKEALNHVFGAKIPGRSKKASL